MVGRLDAAPGTGGNGPEYTNLSVCLCVEEPALLGLSAPGVRGGGGGEGLGEGGGQRRGGVPRVFPGHRELPDLEVVVFDGFIARFEAGSPSALLHLTIRTNNQRQVLTGCMIPGMSAKD